MGSTSLHRHVHKLQVSPLGTPLVRDLQRCDLFDYCEVIEKDDYDYFVFCNIQRSRKDADDPTLVRTKNGPNGGVHFSVP